MNPMALLKKPMALFIVFALVLLVLLTTVATRPAGLFDSWNTDGKDYDVYGCHVSITFSKTKYIGSWLPGMDSESMTVTAQVHEAMVPIGTIAAYRYALYVEGYSAPQQTYPADGSFIIGLVYGGQLMPTWTNVVIKSTADTLRLRVQFEFFTMASDDGDDPLVAWDGAYLVTGEGDVYIPANMNQGPFQEGDTAQVYVKTGYTADMGWSLFLVPPADRTDLDHNPPPFKTLGDGNKGTIIDVPIPLGAYSSASNNKWEVQLWNPYFNYKFTYLLTIDHLDRAPIITNIVVTNNNVSMSYAVYVNRTYADLSKIEVCAWYGYGGTGMPSRDDTESWVLMDVPYPITNGRASFTVTPKNMDGTIIVHVVAYDVGNRPSAPIFESFVVEGGGTTPGPSPLTQPFLWTTTVILLIVAMFAISILVYLYAPLPLQYKLILLIVMALIFIYLIWAAGKLKFGA